MTLLTILTLINTEVRLSSGTAGYPNISLGLLRARGLEVARGLSFQPNFDGRDIARFAGKRILHLLVVQAHAHYLDVSRHSFCQDLSDVHRS